MGVYRGRGSAAGPHMRTSLLVTAGAVALTLGLAGASTVAEAKSSRRATELAQAGMRNFSIPPQSLASGLPAFGQQAGLQVSADAGIVAGLTTRGVTGTMPAESALATLLAGTGLTYRPVGSNAVALERAVASSAAAGGVMLSPITVEGAEPRGAEGFALRTPADTGYRAGRMLSGTKTDTALKDVPQSVSVVTRKQMDDQSVKSMEEAVRYVPGVGFAQGENNRDTPVFRGNATTGDFFVDGIRDDTQYFRDIYNIERVEVFKGANAMIFGRGGSGGVINRVTRQADWAPTRELKLETGSYDHYRSTFDLGQGINDQIALRLTGLYENSDSFRDGVNLERWGLNPTGSFKIGPNTLVQLGYEHFEDKRTTDRGIPSLNGSPYSTSNATFFGDPAQSYAKAEVDAFNAAIEHRFDNGVSLRNRARYATYDKFYQNVFPGAVNPVAQTVAISAYNNATDRKTFVNQTDVTADLATGAITHKLLAGIEFSHQETDNVRKTGTFGGATSVNLPLSNTNQSLSTLYAPTANDATNTGTAKAIGIYLQDQIRFTPQLQAVVGLRHDSFDVDFTDRRATAAMRDISSSDNLWSPRIGLIYSPVEPLSLYASYSLTYVPRAGEQLASLSATNRAFDPEEFRNYEVGAKWDVDGNLALTAAVYHLERKNVVVPDPNNAALSILVDGARTRGVELGASGNVTERWSVIGAYAYQEAELTARQSATVAAGNRLPNTPKHAFALWNRYDFTRAFGLGLGMIYQTARYTSTDNTVTLPSFVRFDAAAYYRITDNVTAQLNVENIFDRDYYSNANSNNNISPGAPRLVRVGLTTRF